MPSLLSFSGLSVLDGPDVSTQGVVETADDVGEALLDKGDEHAGCEDPCSGSYHS